MMSTVRGLSTAVRYDDSMPNEKRDTGNLDSANRTSVERTAYHEAGHMVVAAALGLTLRAEGLHVDPLGAGLACFSKQPDGSDLSRERIIVAIFAGYIAQERSHPDSIWQLDTDWQEAHTLLGEMSIESTEVTRERLLKRSRQLVNQYWLAVKALASALLARNWVPQVRLESGARWAQSTTTTEKHMTAEEIINLLAHYGITAVCGTTS